MTVMTPPDAAITTAAPASPNVSVKRQYFGTDGIRGRVGTAPMTPEFALKLGYAAGKALASKSGDAHPAVLIGKDTRISGYMLENALVSGLSAAGVDTLLVGPMPTPGVAFLTRALRLSAGIMVSASHNPFDDNGIKFFSHEGLKLPDDIELEIEAALTLPLICADPTAIGKARRVHDAEGRYIEFCKAAFPKEQSLKGLTLVVDCAHGAAYRVAPRIFSELGATVVPIGDRPDGLNINDQVGAVTPQAMAQAVQDHAADFGLALDGDGDRLVMADHDGQCFDGDQLLFIIAKHRASQASLKGGVVGTLMSNMALELALAARAIPFARAKVGDRYVLEQLQEKGWEIGGENSGHILCLDKHSTGDAIISSLQVLSALVASQQSLADYSQELTLFPQVMINVRMAQPLDFQRHAGVQAAINAAQSSLDRGNVPGRVLVRASGTEPLIRVMVECADRSIAQELADKIAAAVRLGAQI